MAAQTLSTSSQSAGSQLRQSQQQARQARQVNPRMRGSFLRTQRSRQRNRLNISPSATTYPNIQPIAQRLQDQRTSANMQRLLELQNKARLQQERQRIKAEMASYQLPNLAIDDAQSPEQQEAMEEAYRQEYQNQIMTEEFQRAALKKIQSGMNLTSTRMQNRKMKKIKNQAAKKAQGAAEKIASKMAKTSSKLAWNMEEKICLADAAEPADLELPTIFDIVVSMYRACTAILNDGKKIIPGFLSFVEPDPLFRFWNMKDIKNAARESMNNPLYGSTSNAENMANSFLGWGKALLGGLAILYVAAHFLAILGFIVMIILLLSELGSFIF